MNRVLFTHSYFLRFDPKQWKIMQPYPPLGTLTAAAVVRSLGWEVRLWDPMFASSAAELNTALDAFRPSALVIYDDGFNYLTKMCLTNMREAAFEMTGYAVSRNIPVIICSSDASDHYEKYLDNGAHAVIRGEGERTLAELLRNLNPAGEGYDRIPGVLYRYNGTTRIAPARDVLKNLDDLPMAAWDLVDMELYRQKWMQGYGYFSLNMSSTRGCPFKCNWCAKPIYGNRYNSRSPENVVSELQYLIQNFRPGHIWFTDDIFGLKPGWVSRFSEIIREQNISIRYKIQSRVDLLLEENNIESLALSGCETVWVGAESGSQKILDAMDKGTRVEQIFEATRLMKKHGIRPAFFLQFGYPGETMDDIRSTIAMVKELLPHDIGISVSYPLPGTPFYERVKPELGSKANWSDSDDLALMFSNTYPPGFYKHLHRYVHKTFRIHQGIRGLTSTGGLRSLKSVLGIAYHQPGAWYHRRQLDKFSPLPAAGQPANRDESGVAAAFNHLAPTYDVDFTHSATGTLQRNVVRRYLQRHIDPALYNRVLELNCGTGEDALWLARKGFRVTATDVSEEMIRHARAKQAETGQELNVDFRMLSFNQLDQLNENRFDVVFSNFGGLNCASPEQLQYMAGQVKRLLRPGGKLIAVVMGRKCLIENVYFTFRNKPLKHRRTSRDPVMASIANASFPVWYYSPGEFARYFEPALTDPAVRPVGLFIPPTFLEKPFSKIRAVHNGLGLLEKAAYLYPSLSDYADHYLIEMTRR